MNNKKKNKTLVRYEVFGVIWLIADTDASTSQSPRHCGTVKKSK